MHPTHHWALGIAAGSPSNPTSLPPRPTRRIPLPTPTPRRGAQDQSPLIPAHPGLTEKRLKDKEPDQEAQGAAATAGATWGRHGHFCSPLRSAAPPRGGSAPALLLAGSHGQTTVRIPERLLQDLPLQLIQQRPILTRVLKTPEHIIKSFTLEIFWILSLSVI